MADPRIEFNSAAVRVLADPRRNRTVAQAMYQTAVRVTVSMKAKTPVSRVQPVYATRGAVVPGGRRHAGDFPLRPSGYLRHSVTRFQESDGSWIIGPTADYAEYVNDGTVPHLIESHGPWPLRNRATGQVFGRTVHHPGTRGYHFVERSVEGLSVQTFHQG